MSLVVWLNFIFVYTSPYTLTKLKILTKFFYYISSKIYDHNPSKLKVFFKEWGNVNKRGMLPISAWFECITCDRLYKYLHWSFKTILKVFIVNWNFEWIGRNRVIQ